MSDFVALLEAAENEASQRLKLSAPLKSRQKDVLLSLAQGKNVFAGLPTGYGKSLCYWAPAAAWGWQVWVVSPLVSLIQDQAKACQDLGLQVACWHGGMSRSEKTELKDRMEAGTVNITFLSPERLSQWWESGFIDRLRAAGRGPDLLALDEMHCFEEWREFRDGYKNSFLPIIRLVLRGVQLLGLSASLSRVQAETWMRELCESHVYFGSNLGRENLHLLVAPFDSEEERWLGLISALRGVSFPESALVYCSTRQETNDVSRWLRSVGLGASSYHAGLPPAVRAARSLAFRQGHLRIVCATSAFGMGIDYPRVGRVIHFSPPYSLDSYWQEAGRAGRDGSDAYAIAFWLRSGVASARQMDNLAREKFFLLWRAWASNRCRKKVVAEHFGVEEKNCGSCDRCLRVNRSLGGRANVFPSWLANFGPLSIEDPWWTEPEANLEQWARQKIFSHGENS